MFILPNLIADQLTTLFIKLGIGEHTTEKWVYLPAAWVETAEYEDDNERLLLVRLPTYQIKYSMSWMENKWHQGAILWTNKKGFRFTWVLAE